MNRYSDQPIIASIIFAFDQQLKQQRDSVKKYQKRILQDIDKEREMAKQLLKDNRKE